MSKKLLLGFLLIVLVIASSIASAENTPTTKSEVVLTKVSFYKADLVAVLQELASQCGYNVIVTPEVKGNVTIQLSNVSFEEVLQFTMQSQGLVYQREGHNFFIGRPGQLSKDQKQTGYFHIYYAEPKQVAEMVKQTVGSQEIYTDERTRTIIANGPREMLTKIDEVIRVLDRKLPQITIEVKVVEVSILALRRLGAELQIDDSSLDWGVTSSGSELILSMISGGHSWSAIFKSLTKDGKARLVTSPSISTVDGREASILIGDKIPLETKTIDSNDNETTTVTYLDVGVKLSFTPQVQQDDEIAINIKTLVNSLGEKTGNYYIIGTREVNTSTQAKIGETIFLGGLITQEERESMMKIPILSKIFLLGKLFRYSEKTKDETELIITITPRWNSSMSLIKSP